MPVPILSLLVNWNRAPASPPLSSPAPSPLGLEGVVGEGVGGIDGLHPDAICAPLMSPSPENAAD